MVDEPTGSLRGYAKGPFAVDSGARYDLPRLRRERVESAQRKLADAGVDGLLVWKDENVPFLTSLRAQLTAGKTVALNGALLGASDSPVLLCSGGEIGRPGPACPGSARPTPSPSWSRPSWSTAS
jgi:Xaa-Pro aminopeptidase